MTGQLDERPPWAARDVASRAHWFTDGGVEISRHSVRVDPASARAELESALDHHPGLLLWSGYEQPGRYRMSGIGYTAPPLEITGQGRSLRARALNARGRVLLPVVAAAWQGLLGSLGQGDDEVSGVVPVSEEVFAEEERTRQPSVFTALRALAGRLAAPADPLLGLFGAFGYDLIFQFDPVEQRLARGDGDRDLVLHLPDVLTEIDPVQGTAMRHCYEFTVDGKSTVGLPRVAAEAPFRGGRTPVADRDHREGEYADVVRLAKDQFRAGELYEVVPGQCLHRRCAAPPSTLFRRLVRRSPAPYGLLANLGAGEFLVGASPEMFVRVSRTDGTSQPARLRLESCPVSGTIARGDDAVEDAERIRQLLNSAKDESELTMCTDVDRNDKARVCEPGTIRVIGRRQVELYATVIHTVDHVEGVLRGDRDALDAFLTHLWAVTVTGAPKRAAIRFLEQHERSPRRWYGGAVGRVGFDGGMDTALTLRTIQIRDGVATVRVGATLLHDSEPAAEEAETLLKARALLEVLEGPPRTARPDRPAAGPASPARAGAHPGTLPGCGPTVLLVDHQDSFVHTLADYFRQAGARVVTYRSGFPGTLLDTLRPDLMVLSPGPGRPADFGVGESLEAARRRGLAVFGVCLGLQGMVEYLGGTLRVLDTPVHGKPSRVRLVGGGGRVLSGLPPTFQAARYHSLHADPATLPSELTVTASAEDGVIMAVEHRVLPWAAVQFHPESILTQRERCGHLVIANAVSRLGRTATPVRRPPSPVPAGVHPLIADEERTAFMTRAGGSS
jgi:anthranilate synthase